MKALILTGGLGTRLRPLTCRVPKPLLPLLNRPFLHYQFENLGRHGVREAVLATARSVDAYRKALLPGKTGLAVRFSTETEPLGTGGAIRNARRHLDGTTLILNGDVLHLFDISAFLRFHRKMRAEVSIALIRVKDPTKYGLVESDRTGRVLRFTEKPRPDQVRCDTINAGAYLFEPSALRSLPLEKPYSVERGFFPRLLAEKRPLYSFISRGYWLDIGTVDSYLQAHLDILGGRAPFTPASLSGRSKLVAGTGVRFGSGTRHEGPGRTLLGRGTRVGAGVRFAGSVCVGEGCSIGEGCVLEDCVILDGAGIGARAKLNGMVAAPRCRIGADAELGPGTVLGEGSRLSDFSRS